MSTEASPSAACFDLLALGIDIDKLNIGEPFSIPLHVLDSLPSLRGVSQVVQQLGKECTARGLTLSEWIDQPTGNHMFKVDSRNVLTLAKLQSCHAILAGADLLSYQETDSPT